MRKIALFFFWLSLCGWAYTAHAATVLGNPVPMLQSGAAEKSHVFKASAGFLYSINVGPSSTAGYLMLFDATAAPSDGAVTPVACFNVPASTNVYRDFYWPFPFVNGIVAEFSTTGCFSATGSNAFFSAQVR